MLTAKENEILEGLDAYKTVGEYRLYLEWENGYQNVRFRIEEGRGTFWFEQSHYTKTPLQGGAYRTSVAHGESLEEALRAQLGR